MYGNGRPSMTSRIASRTAGGAPKSGSPMPSLTTRWPCASRRAAWSPNANAWNGSALWARCESFIALGR